MKENFGSFLILFLPNFLELYLKVSPNYENKNNCFEKANKIQS